MPQDPFNEFLLLQASQIIADNPAGLFVTQGPAGFPAARWCLGSATPDLSRLYLLTRTGSRKLYDLEARPECTWVFSSPQHDDVVTVMGIARALDSFLNVDADWDKLVDQLQKYEAGPTRRSESFQSMVGIEVVARKIEILSPRLSINTPTPIDLLLQRDDATIDR